MRPYRKLPHLCNAFRRRVQRLSTRLDRTLPLPDTDRDVQVTYCLLELANAWAAFSRSYFLSCAVLGARTNSGLITVERVDRFPDYDAAIIGAIRVRRPGFSGARASHADEPDWSAKATLRQISTGLRFRNSIAISNALSTSTNVHAQIQTIRNFFAHRAEETNAKALGAARRHIGLAVSPRNYPFELIPMRPVRVYEGWVQDLLQIASDLES